MLPRPIVVQYGHTPFNCEACESHAFVDTLTFEKLVATAEVLIFHAGAGSVLNAIRAGRVPVIVPRRAALGEHVNDHQVEFARLLAKEGRILLVEDVSDLGDAVVKVRIPSALSKMDMRTVPPLVAAINQVLMRYASQAPDNQ